MNLDIHICPTNLLTQKQLQEIADLTTFCHRHDGIELSYPVEEEHLTHTSWVISRMAVWQPV